MKDPAVDLWAIDEVHFQQHGSRCQMWIPPETKDPVCCMLRRGEVSDTFALCSCGMGNFSIAASRVSLTAKPGVNPLGETRGKEHGCRFDPPRILRHKIS
jgi:hypothetical protein